MKLFYLLSSFCLFSIHDLDAQIIPEFPDGIYLTLDQLKNKTPAYTTKLRVIKRNSGDAFWGGGNDFKLESDIDTLKPRFFRNKIYAYVTNDSIFLNCEKIGLQKFYSLCLTRGNFLAFKACMETSEAATYAVLGGALLMASLSNIRYLYVLSLRTGNTRKLDKDYVAARLEENKNLLAQFEAESKQNSEGVLLKYINQLNGYILPDSQPPADSSGIKTKRKRK